MSEKLNSGEQIQDNGELNEWEEMAKNAPAFMGSGSKGLETHAGPDVTPMDVTEAPEGRRIVSADGEYIPETPTPGGGLNLLPLKNLIIYMQKGQILILDTK